MRILLATKYCKKFEPLLLPLLHQLIQPTSKHLQEKAVIGWMVLEIYLYFTFPVRAFGFVVVVAVADADAIYQVLKSIS
jgi:hypothetical protein